MTRPKNSLLVEVPLLVWLVLVWGALWGDFGVGNLVFGALLCLTSSVGLVRLSDLYARMHAATKPQALGLLLSLLGLGLMLRSGLDVGMLVLIAIFQMLTIPVSAHLVARARYRDENPR